MLANRTLLIASNLNNAYVSQTNTNPQSINSTLTISGGALTLKNSVITDNANSSYMRIDPQGNNVIIYDGVNNQRLDIYSSSGSESTYIQTVNGTKSFGQIDVSSAIDHLEINTNSLKPVIFGSNLTANGIISGNRIILNNVNTQLQFQESGNNKWHFESVGGTLNFVESGVTNRATLSPSTGNLTLLTGKLTAQTGVGIKGTNLLSFDDYGGGFQMTDSTWIRTTGSKSFYQNSGTMRTDGTLQVGNNGATLNVPNGGQLNYNSGKFTVDTTGVITTTGPINMNTTKSQHTGISLDGVYIDTVGSSGNIALQNLNQLRFGNSNAWDYNQWAGIKYDSTNLMLYIGGPASTHFSSNASPATIDMAFTGVGNVGIGTDSPSKMLDVAGDIRLTSNLYNPNIVNLYSDTGTSQGMKVGSLAITSLYTDNAPTNGLYVQGNVGINQTSPAYNLDVNGTINAVGIIYSPASNSPAYQIGNDAQLWDVNVSNTVGIYGVQNSSVGGLKLGSTGPTLYGTGNSLGINTTTPNTAYALHVNGNMYTTGTSTVGTTVMTNQADGSLRFSNPNGYIDIAPKNSTYAHIYTDRPSFYFNQDLYVLGSKVWHAGNISPVSKTGDSMTGNLSFTNQNNGIQLNSYVSNASTPLTITGGAFITAGSDYAGLSKIGNIAVQTWYGFSVSPTITGQVIPQGTPAFAVNARTGEAWIQGNLYMSNKPISGITSLTGQYGTIANSRTDEWLGLNDDGTHTSGAYFGSSIVRTDGTLQIGSGGATLSIPQNGTFNWMGGKFTIASSGTVTSTGPIVVNSAKNQGTGFKLDTVTIDTVLTTGNVAIGGLNQLRFGDGTAFDWNTWAGIKYNNTNKQLIIGGPSSTYFSSNANPSTIATIFDGVSGVGVNMTPRSGVALDVNGDIGVASGHSLWVGNNSDSGAVTRIHNNGTDAYIDFGANLHIRNSSATDILYVSSGGSVGIGTTNPSRKIDVNGDSRINGNVYSGQSYLGFLTDSGATLPIKAGSLAITNSYSNNAPTNGLYVQGGVGIGTTAPTSMFQVVESGMQMYTVSDHIYLQKIGGTQYPYLGFVDSGGTRGGYIGWGTIGSHLDIALENNNNLYVNLTNGNNKVGIGNANPSNTLDVTGTIGTTSTIISMASGNDIFQAMGGTGVKTFRFENGNLRFWNSTSLEMMTLATNGNIGINQASPAYKLDVNGTINATGIIYSPASNSQAYQVGSNSGLWDVGVTNTLGLYGVSNTAVGALKLGSTGPTLYGSGGTLGIGTTTPSTLVALDVNGNIRVASGKGIWSAYNNNYILNDHGNGNVTLSATNSASGNLYLGYVNTSAVRLYTKMVGSDGVTNILGTDGTLYYKGNDTDGRYLIKSGDTMTGTLTVNKTATHIQLQESAVNKWHIESVSGLFKFVETGVASRFTIASGGATNLYGTFNMNNNALSGITTIAGQYGRIANSRSDEWLGLNDDGSHTSGVYFGSSIVRTDGTFQVGNAGQYLNINSTQATINTNTHINAGTSGYTIDIGKGRYYATSGSTANGDGIYGSNYLHLGAENGLDFWAESGNINFYTGTQGATSNPLTITSGGNVMMGNAYAKSYTATPSNSTLTNITGNGWYNIASNPSGDRAFGTFTLMDESVGKHHVVQFNAASAYGVGSTNTVFFMANTRAGNKVFTNIRIVYNSTNEYFLQAFINNVPSGGSATVRCILDNNYWDSGWTLRNFDAGTVPTGYSTDQYDITGFDKKPNVWTGTGAPPSYGAGVGDLYIQY